MPNVPTRKVAAPDSAAAAMPGWFSELVQQVAALHATGRLHGAIAAGGARFDDPGHPRLTAPGDSVTLVSDDAAGTCPPEFPADRQWTLPTAIDEASAALTKAGIHVDPRRVDVYQLGVLLCRQAGIDSVAEYLRSPKARGKIPAAWRKLIDRSLGHDAATRLSDCQQVAAIIAQANEDALRYWTGDTPASGTLHTPVTIPHISAASDVQPAEVRVAEDGAAQGSGEKPRSNQPYLAPRERLGAYQIIERIGGGGMGDVYKAHEESLDRIVAVKVLPPELARHADFVRRFRAEAMAIAKLMHPNIVQVFAAARMRAGIILPCSLSKGSRWPTCCTTASGCRWAKRCPSSSSAWRDWRPPIAAS